MLSLGEKLCQISKARGLTQENIALLFKTDFQPVTRKKREPSYKSDVCPLELWRFQF